MHSSAKNSLIIKANSSGFSSCQKCPQKGINSNRQAPGISSNNFLPHDGESSWSSAAQIIIVGLLNFFRHGTAFIVYFESPANRNFLNRLKFFQLLRPGLRYSRSTKRTGGLLLDPVSR